MYGVKAYLAYLVIFGRILASFFFLPLLESKSQFLHQFHMKKDPE